MEKYRKITYNDVIVDIARDITKWKFNLKKMLKDCGEDVDNKSFVELINMVNDLKIMRKNKKYKGILKDSNGYIIGLYHLHDFVDTEQIPSDIDYGYYKINKDGVLEIDYERKRQLDEV